MTPQQLAALPGAQHIDAFLTFRHSPNQADIHHFLPDASVLYTLSLYPTFDQILVKIREPQQANSYLARC